MRPLPAVAVAVLAAGCLDAEAPADPSRPEPFVFEVPGGASGSGLAARLEAEGLVDGAFWWRVYLRTVDDAGCLKAGRHEVSRAMGMRALWETLCAPPLPEDVPFTVVEGWRIVEIDAALAARGWIEPGAYAALATTKAVEAPFPVPGPTFEGYLFPDTYGVVPDRFTAEAFLARQLASFHEAFVVPYGAQLGERSLHDVVVMASMVEKEEKQPQNRPIVAGILWKRLDNGWKLGVDATSRYTLDDWSDRRAFLGKLRDPSDPYNTRLLKGLPPTAIGNPGLDALRATLAPEDTPFWYYLHDGDGVLRGARDGAGHAANRQRYDVY